MAPGPFCCYSAIPSTLRYLSHLLPKQTTHNPLAKNKGSAPLLTSFLAHLTTNVLPISDTIPDGTSPLFYAIIQVKRSQPLEQTRQGMGMVTGNSESALSSASSSTSIISAPGTQARTQTTRSSSHRSNSSTACLTTGAGTSYSEERYFVPLEKSNESTALDPASRVFSRGFREIKTREAMESLRFPESGIVIGDGEDWRELEGTERLWCGAHRVWFELRVWVREGVV